MALKKQMVTHNSAPSKGRTNTNAEGNVLPHAADREYATDNVDSSSAQGTAISAQPPLYEG